MEGPGRPLRLDEPLETWPAVVLLIGAPAGLGEATRDVLRGVPDHEAGLGPRDHIECVVTTPDEAVAGARLEAARDDIVRRGSLSGRRDVKWSQTIGGVRAPELVVIVSAHDLEARADLRAELAAQTSRYGHTTLLVHDWPADRRVDVREGDLARKLLELIPHADGPLLVALVDIETGRPQAERALAAMILDLQRRPYMDQAPPARPAPPTRQTEIWRVWIHGAELDKGRIARHEAEPVLVQAVRQLAIREVRGDESLRFRSGEELLDCISKHARDELKIHPTYADAVDPDLGADGPAVKLGEKQTHVHVATPTGLGARPKGVSPFRLEEYLVSLDAALMNGRVWYWIRSLDDGVGEYIDDVADDLRSVVPTWAQTTASLPYVRRQLADVPEGYRLRLATELSEGRLPSFRLALEGLRDAVRQMPQLASVVTRGVFLLLPIALAVVAAVTAERYVFAVAGALLGLGALTWIGGAEAVARTRVTRAYDHAKRCLRARVKRAALGALGDVFAGASDRIGGVVATWVRGLKRVEEDLVRDLAETTTEAPTVPEPTVGRVSAWRAEHPGGLFDSLWEQELGGKRSLKETAELIAVIGDALAETVAAALHLPEEAEPLERLRTAVRAFVTQRIADIRLWRAYTLHPDHPEADQATFISRFVEGIVRTIEEMKHHVDADVRQAMMQPPNRRRPFVAPEMLRRWHPDADVTRSHRSVGEWCYVRFAVRLAVREKPEDNA